MTPPKWFPVLAAILAAASGHGLAGSRSLAQATTPPVLSAGATFERRAAARNIDRYDAVLTAGDFLEVSVTQDQFPVILSIHGADGAALHSIDLAGLDPLPERLMF